MSETLQKCLLIQNFQFPSLMYWQQTSSIFGERASLDCPYAWTEGCLFSLRFAVPTLNYWTCYCARLLHHSALHDTEEIHISCFGMILRHFSHLFSRAPSVLLHFEHAPLANDHLCSNSISFHLQLQQSRHVLGFLNFYIVPKVMFLRQQCTTRVIRLFYY